MGIIHSHVIPEYWDRHVLVFHVWNRNIIIMENLYIFRRANHPPRFPLLMNILHIIFGIIISFNFWNMSYRKYCINAVRRIGKTYIFGGFKYVRYQKNTEIYFRLSWLNIENVLTLAWLRCLSCAIFQWSWWSRYRLIVLVYLSFATVQLVGALRNQSIQRENHGLFPWFLWTCLFL